jgi:hypothetical protein
LARVRFAYVCLLEPAFWQIAGVNATPEDDDLVDVLETLSNPDRRDRQHELAE